MKAANTPLDRYQQALDSHYLPDPAQAEAMTELQDLYYRLLQQPSPNLIQRAGLALGLKRKAPVGIYLWGGVGRGKTWLMDLFYESLPVQRKYRAHFHRFMQQVHDEMQALQGLKNPLKHLARGFAKRYQIICFDEFHVADITDAMILYGLLKYLQRYGTTLVYTSNQQPDDLYLNGLQRERFLPAIELIKNSCKIIHIDGQTDHRLRLLTENNTFYSPLSEKVTDKIIQRFDELAPCRPKSQASITINHRQLETVKLSDDVVWFDFERLFNSPRGTADYLELAKRFHTVFITEIPVLDENNDDKAKRFIHLIDEFYDRKVKVLITAAVTPDMLYQGTRHKKDFERTASRLEEMRSIEYLKQAHRP